MHRRVPRVRRCVGARTGAGSRMVLGVVGSRPAGARVVMVGVVVRLGRHVELLELADRRVVPDLLDLLLQLRNVLCSLAEHRRL